jgi:hypothetical protein
MTALQTVATIQLHDCYINNLTFRQKYKTIYKQEPKVDKLIQYKWFVSLRGASSDQFDANRDIGDDLSESDYLVARAEMETFRSFLRSEIFTKGTIMLLPNGDCDISYRDQPFMLALAFRGPEVRAILTYGKW